MGRRYMFMKLSTIAVLAMALLVSAMLLVKSLLAAPDGQAAVATVNGDVVTAAELAYFAGLHRASVIEVFLAEEGVEMDGGFWKRDFRGTTPIETLRELAMNDAVAMKAELQLARELGLVSDISYASLLKAMEEENARRAKAVANGEPVYGPAKFEERAFIDWYRSKLASSAKESWAESELKPDERELRMFYEKVKSALTPMEDSLTYDQIVIAYRQDGESVDARMEEAFQTATAIRERLLSGVASAEAALGDVPIPAGIVVLNEGELVLDADSASRMYKSENALYTALMTSSAEQPITPVIDDRASGRYVVARVMGRQAAEAPGFGEVRDVVRKLFVEEKYAAYVRSRAESASIELLPGYRESALGVE